MASAYRLTKQQQQEAAVAFGNMLKRWRALNGWTQYTAVEWAREAGDFESPPHTGVSELENGQVRSPRPGTFIRLAEINARTHAGDFHGVTSRKIRDELTGSQAILDEHGEPWGPAQFWEAHCGLRPIPPHLGPVPMVPMPEISEDQAAELGSAWRQTVVDAGKARGMGPIKSMGDFVRTIPAAYRDAMEHGLSLEFTPATLAPMWDAAKGAWMPTEWVAAWLKSEG